MNTPLPVPSVFLLLFGRGGGVVFFLFLLFAPGRVYLFAVWAGCVFLFAVWAGHVFIFAVWAGRVDLLLFGRVFLFCCCLGGGRVYLCAVWAGDGSSLTYQSAWLVFKVPNNKKDQTAKKKNTGSSKLGWPLKNIWGLGSRKIMS